MVAGARTSANQEVSWDALVDQLLADEDAAAYGHPRERPISRRAITDIAVALSAATADEYALIGGAALAVWDAHGQGPIPGYQTGDVDAVVRRLPSVPGWEPAGMVSVDGGAGATFQVPADGRIVQVDIFVPAPGTMDGALFASALKTARVIEPGVRVAEAEAVLATKLGMRWRTKDLGAVERAISQGGFDPGRILRFARTTAEYAGLPTTATRALADRLLEITSASDGDYQAGLRSI